MRGLHFQTGKNAQAKIVTCIYGSILDVTVNLSEETNSFGKVYHFCLKGGSGKSVYVPPNFAHGYITLHSDTIVHYSFDRIFTPEHSGTLNFFDKSLKISLPNLNEEATISDKDKLGISLNEASLRFKSGI